MSIQKTFEGRLAPINVQQATASDTRDFTVSIDPQASWNDVYDAIQDEIIETGVVDAWAFDNHWEIAVVTQVGANRSQQLRDLLRSCRHTIPVNDKASVMTFQMYDERADEWDETRLQVSSDVYSDFDEWQGSINNRNLTSFVLTFGPVHEASIRGVAESCPSLCDSFLSEPLLSQTRFLQLALDNEQTVTDHLNEVTV